MSNIKVISQYINNLDFSLPNGASTFIAENSKPDINLTIDLDAKKIINNNSKENIFEVILKIKAEAKNKDLDLFQLQISYGGLFSLENIDEELTQQILLVYCPNLLFPFLRRIIANITADAGFPSLMLDLIDFNTLYLKRKNIAKSEPINNTKN